MKASPVRASTSDAQTACPWNFRDMPEEEQIAALIRLFSLPPVLRVPDAIWVSQIGHSTFYDIQNPAHDKFDPTYPQPIGGRKSKRRPVQYWTVEVLLWHVRTGTSGCRGGAND